eukprot:11272536-Alexandrium_andersonii.AAC.1
MSPHCRHVSSASVASVAAKPCRVHSSSTRSTGMGAPAPSASSPLRPGWRRKSRMTSSGLSRG